MAGLQSQSPRHFAGQQLLRKQTNTGSSTARAAETQRTTRTRFRVLSALVTLPRARERFLQTELETLWN